VAYNATFVYLIAKALVGTTEAEGTDASGCRSHKWQRRVNGRNGAERGQVPPMNFFDRNGGSEKNCIKMTTLFLCVWKNLLFSTGKMKKWSWKTPPTQWEWLNEGAEVGE
jgi:hypothetical protein